MPTADKKFVVYGGYSKEKIKKDVERGCIHADMFLLSPTDKNDLTKYKWVCMKQTGIRLTPRCGLSVALFQYANQAFIFGGVFDDNDSDDDDEESLRGTFYNDLFVLDLEKLHWRAITLSEKKATTLNDDTKRQRKKEKEEEPDEELEPSNNSDQEKSEKSPNPVQSTVTVDDDGIFTVCFFYAHIKYILIHKSCIKILKRFLRILKGSYPYFNFHTAIIQKHGILVKKCFK